jgi:light-regulated signal transduction histidine kinase (bacteriophytochrome)
VQDTFVVLEAEGGRIVRAIGSAIDITTRKKHEEQLRVSNDGLQQFAYAAAHDLQEPLRVVMIFTQMLTNAFEGKLTEPASTWLSYVTDSTWRMHELLRDLRVYAEIAQDQHGEKIACDANRALRRAIEQLEPALQESAAQVEFGVLPRVWCREAYLVQLFQNLLSNAVKYRSEAPPKIKVSAERLPGEWLFSVEDNGIGIDENYASQVFSMFRRLDKNVSGTGMGLAICTKVIERCGGRIWVEPNRLNGSIFHFTMPNQSDAGPGIASE